MKKLALLLPAVAAFVCLFMFATPSHAQASRTWVSGVGDDVNPCSRTAPCKTFAGAISKTAVNGEINCLDPGGFGAVTITKSITIDCHEIFGSVLHSATNGITINFNSFTDTRKTVRLRNINFNGFNSGLNAVRILSNAGVAADSEVFIEDCLIDGNFGSASRGISDERLGGGKLFISDTTVRNIGSNGIVVGGQATVDASLDNVRVQNANNALTVANGARVMVTRSVFSGNSGAGVFVFAGAQVNIDGSVSSNNGTGVQNSGTVRLSNTDIAFNATGITGATLSFGNNRISGNTAAGTAPTAIGGVSNTFGQQ